MQKHPPNFGGCFADFRVVDRNQRIRFGRTRSFFTEA